MAKSSRNQRVRLGAKNQLTIPQQAVSLLGLNTGDYLELRVREDRIELVPMALVPRDQAWFWTPEWQAKEKEADEALASGRYQEHKSADRAISDLKS